MKRFSGREGRTAARDGAWRRREMGSGMEGDGTNRGLTTTQASPWTSRSKRKATTNI